MLYQVLMPGVCDIVYQVREQRVGCFTSHTSTCTDSFFLPMRQQHVGLQKQNKPCTKAHSCLEKDVDLLWPFYNQMIHHAWCGGGLRLRFLAKLSEKKKTMGLPRKRWVACVKPPQRARCCGFLGLGFIIRDKKK